MGYLDELIGEILNGESKQGDKEGSRSTDIEVHSSIKDIRDVHVETSDTSG